MSGKIKEAHAPAGWILGMNKRGYPAQYGFVTGLVEVTVVLVAGGIGDYAAYVGMGEPEWIARHGDKLPFKEACIHFPVGLKEELYRQ